MRQKLFKNVMAFAIITLVITSAMAINVSIASAQGTNVLWGNLESNISNAIGLGNQDPRVVAAKIINVFLGFLGIIAVVIILLGGFKWMTAGGNEDSVAEAKKYMSAGVIGLVIVLMSWALAKFIVDNLYQATQ